MLQPEERLGLSIANEKRQEFAELFQEFVESYPKTEAGRAHVRSYAAGREEALVNYPAIKRAAEAGEDVTDAILAKLLPHQDTRANRERGAWVHIAPAVAGDVKVKFEATGWTRSEDWPKIARAILDFVSTCLEDPDSLLSACEHFAELPYTKGLQTGFMTPILNALDPEHFIIINNKSRRVINYLAGEKYSQKITDYPAMNAVELELIRSMSDILKAEELGELSTADAFDMFVHWAAAIKKVDWATKGRGRKGSGVEYWKIAPGGKAENWDACREGSYIAIGWSQFGDVRGLSRDEFNAQRDSLVESKPDWTKGGADQVWRFTKIPVGSVIVANRGTAEVLGIGTVTGGCYYVEGEDYPHRLPVDWSDVGSRRVSEGGWRRTMVKLDADKVDAIRSLPVAGGSEVAETAVAWEADERSLHGKQLLTQATLDILDSLSADPSKEFYDSNKEALYKHLVTPFKALMSRAGELLPQSILEAMETEKRIFSSILKQFSKYGCWGYYWGAFYPKGGRRTQDAQLFAVLRPEGLEYGFSTGDYSSEQTDRLVHNLTTSRARVKELLGDVLADPDIMLGARDEDGEEETSRLSFDEWLASDSEDDLSRAAKVVSREQLLSLDPEDLAQDIVHTFEALFPLVLLAIEDNPWPAVGGYLEIAVANEHDEAPEFQGAYDLEDFVADTGFPEEEIESWERRLRRKKHVIFQGPPGTGKTFVAERLARMLVSGTRGFWEVVQFHPSYAYEDFMQGLRPTPVAGGLSFKLEPGRFLDFCARARTEAQGDPCVLLIDEINRAHLSRVFGELMYLLEYRHEEIPLASGGRPFKIPENVYLIGTMNTADRSIALVDHALRRRFSFIRLRPEYDVLQRYLDEHIEDGDSLVSALRKVNEAIGDPNYQMGISYFMKDGENLPDVLGDIWVGEIEPYLEEFFYDNVSKVDVFRWESLKEGELSDWVE